MRIEVLVLCDFKGNKVRGNHVADRLELGETLGSDLGDWMKGSVHLRKVS